MGHVLDYVMQDPMIGQYRQQGICAIIAVIGIDQQICRPNGPHMRHPFDDKRGLVTQGGHCLLYTSPSPRDRQKSRMPSSA